LGIGHSALAIENTRVIPMTSITEDLVLGARFTIEKSGGVMLRIFEVTGLTPGIDTLAQAALAQDGASGARIPAYGDPHPLVSGLYVNEVDVQPIASSRTSAKVAVRYATPEAMSVPNAVKIQITGSSRAKLIGKNPADGSMFMVKYTDPSGNLLQQFLQVPVLSPNTILEFTRQELRSPLKRSQSVRRTVNSSPWQNGDAKTWLCRGIDATSLDNLARYEVKYIFEYDPDGWTRTEYFHDTYTGKIPDDVQTSQGNDQGIANILPYATSDFSQLGLPNAF
jgi:hypothetical protein